MATNCSINTTYNSKTKTCMKMSTLKKLAKKMNKDNRFGQINIEKFDKKNKDKFLKVIKKGLGCTSNLDFCVLKKEDEFYDVLNEDFKPKGPIDEKEWLSSLDLINIMDHYEKKYTDFEFLGPFPIDFHFIYKDFMNLNLKKLIKEHKKLGIIFNTDVSSGPGEHWISLFLDLDNKTVCFFDSVGMKPPKEVTRLINDLIKSAKKNYNVKLKKVINCTQYQFGDSACGVFALWFIISRLKGETCNNLFNKSLKDINDKSINNLRKKYFRN